MAGLVQDRVFGLGIRQECHTLGAPLTLLLGTIILLLVMHLKELNPRQQTTGKLPQPPMRLVMMRANTHPFCLERTIQHPRAGGPAREHLWMVGLPSSFWQKGRKAVLTVWVTRSICNQQAGDSKAGTKTKQKVCDLHYVINCYCYTVMRGIYCVLLQNVL